MSCCAQYIRRINPVTGVAVVYDTLTGQIVTDPLILARLACCPTKQIDKEEICLIPIGSVDPADIIQGWQVSVFQVEASGVLTVLSTSLYSKDLQTDLTATHEVTACPNETPIDIPLCDPGA